MKNFLQAQGAIAAGFVLASLLVSTQAMAADPYFSGPSVSRNPATAMFTGQGFTPNGALTVMVRSPDGTTSGHGAVAAPDGSFAYTLAPARTGAYSITVTDSGGRPLASAVIAVLP